MPAAVTRLSTPPRSEHGARHDRVVVDGTGRVAPDVFRSPAELLDEGDRLRSRGRRSRRRPRRRRPPRRTVRNRPGRCRWHHPSPLRPCRPAGPSPTPLARRCRHMFICPHDGDDRPLRPRRLRRTVRRTRCFAELRRTQPVYFQEMAGEPGYWAVLQARRCRARRPRAEAVLGERGRRDAREPRARAARDDAQHAARDGPAAPRRLPPPDRAALQGARHRADGRRRSARSAARSWPTRPREGDVEFVHDVTSRCRRASSASSWACPTDDCR